MKVKIFILFLLLSVQASAQKFFQNAIQQHPVVHLDSSTVHVELMTSAKKIKPVDHKFYYWYAARDIKRTRGDFSGKLLHGQYSEFYLNKNLKEKGKVKYGLKYGIWKSWHFNGEYHEISKWKKGVKQGKYIIYTESGLVSEVGKFKKDKQVGIKRIYKDGKFSHKVKYRNGQLLKAKEKPETKKTIKLEKKNQESGEAETSDIKVKKKTKVKKVKEKSTKQDRGGGRGKVKEEKEKGVPKEKKKKKEGNEIKIKRMIKIVPLKNDKLKET